MTTAVAAMAMMILVRVECMSASPETFAL